MVTQNPTWAILIGFGLRLGLPVLITLVAIYFLRRLDALWQAQAKQENHRPIVAKADCWKVKGCTPEQRQACAALSSPLPCWQAFRLKDGRLKEECLSCEVFLKAPVPSNA
jgi:hypothetical protein